MSADEKGYRYRIVYRDGDVGPYSCIYHATSEEHARERFYENEDDADGWEIVSITRLPEKPGDVARLRT